MANLKPALDHFRTYTRIGEVCDVSRQAVKEWEDNDCIPSEHCVTLERESGGIVTRVALMPEIFGPIPAKEEVSH